MLRHTAHFFLTQMEVILPLCPHIPAGLINSQGRLWNPCSPSDCGPLAQKPSAQVTSDGSTRSQGLTGSSTAKRGISETFLYAAKSRVCGRIISKRGSVYPARHSRPFMLGADNPTATSKQPRITKLFKGIKFPPESKSYAGKMTWKSRKRGQIFFKECLTLFCHCQRSTAAWYRVLVKVTWKQMKGNKWYRFCARPSNVTGNSVIMWHSPLCKVELQSLALGSGGSYQCVFWRGTIWSWRGLASTKQTSTGVSEVNMVRCGGGLG